MTKFGALVKLNFRALLASLRVGGSRKRMGNGWAALVLMGAVCLYVSGWYSFLMASQLAEVGGLELIFLVMPVLAVVAGLLFTLFAVQGVVFGGRDTDLMLSLPVSAFQVMLARVLALYLETLFFSVLILAPAGAAWLWYGGEGGVFFLLRLAVGIVFLALLPTVLALAGGFVLSWCASRAVHKTQLTIVLYLLLMVGAAAVSIRFQMAVYGLAAEGMGARMEDAFNGWGIPFQLFRAGILGDGLALGGFGLLSTLALLAACALFAPSYPRILTGLSTHRKQTNYQLGRLAASGSWKALLVKEGARFFGTPIYLFNAGFGLLLLVVGGMAAGAERDRLQTLLDQPGLEGLPVMPLAAAAVLLLLSTVAVTASSISLEGRNLWILKEAPVETGAILRAKAGFQVLVTLPCLLIGVAGLTRGLGLTAAQGAELFLLGTAFAGFDAALGLAINLCHPKLDAINDMVVVKQSMTSVMAVFGGMAAAAAVVGSFWGLREALGELGGVLLCVALLLAGGAGTIQWLRTRGAERFQAL